MPELAVENQVVATPSVVEPEAAAPQEISDLLVEDVSIDGMCGVY